MILQFVGNEHKEGVNHEITCECPPSSMRGISKGSDNGGKKMDNAKEEQEPPQERPNKEEYRCSEFKEERRYLDFSAVNK